MSLDISKREASALVEMARRRTTSVDLFRAQPHQDPIFESMARELLVRGGVRSGKSTSLGELTAAIAMDSFVTLSDGRKVRARRPHQIGRPLTIWIIGYDQRHIGETIYRILFKPGLFKLIRDEHTGQLRAFDQNNPSDAARSEEAMPSFPLIPNRYIKPKSWDWENASNKEFKKVTIWDPVTKETLADIYAYSSKAEPKQGDPVDVVWIDEAVKYPGHYSEWQSRLADRRGRLYWSSWPRANNAALRALTNRAKQEDPHSPSPMAQEVILRTSENAQLDPTGKRELLAGFTPEELASRDRGEYSLDQLKMYPLFDKSYHCASYPEEVDDKISKILRQSMWNPPADWTRELILDPGTNHPAVLFCAIPPPQYGDYYVVFDELYPGRADANTLAPMIKAKMKGYPFYRFIIDQRAGKQTTMGFSLSVADNYSRAFKENNIASQITGNHFVWGSPNVEARIMRLQSWMHVNQKEGSYPYLRILSDKCPQLCKQLEDYVKEDVENNNTIGDRPAKGQAIDLAQCYDDQTEVLTKDGWKFFRDCNETDLLATFNLDTQAMEYQKPTQYTKRYYSGEMVRIKSRRLDLCVTPEHRMVVRKQSGRLQVVRADQLKKTDRIPLCPKSWSGTRPRIKMPKQHNGRNHIEQIKDVVSFAEFMGWFVAEGCTKKYRKKGRGYQVAISQKKEWGRSILEDCLARNPFHYTKDGVNYLISHKQLWHFLRPLGKSNEKYVPQWIKDADVEVIGAFLRGYIWGDGHTTESGRAATSSASKRLSDDIQELCLKVGWAAARINRDVRGGVINGRAVVAKYAYHGVSISKKTVDALLYRKSPDNASCQSIVSRQIYSGFVYCASVSNTTLVVRRNGRVCISGNCLEYWAASFPKWIPVARNNIGGGSPAYQLYQRLKAESDARSKPKDESVVFGTSLTPYRV